MSTDGNGITGELLKSFVTSLVPIMIPVALGGALRVKDILTLPHVDGMITFIFWVGLPALVFRRIALSNPGTLDFNLLGADALSKLIPLVLLLFWRKFFSKSGRVQSFEWVITFFMLSTLPNTVLIGDSVLNPMFGAEIESETTVIIFAQSLYWYNVCIILYEIRELMLEDEKMKVALPISAEKISEAVNLPECITPKELEARAAHESAPPGPPGEGKLSRSSSTTRGRCSSRSFSRSFSSSFRVVPMDIALEEKPGTLSESNDPKMGRTGMQDVINEHPQSVVMSSTISDETLRQSQWKDFEKAAVELEEANGSDILSIQGLAFETTEKKEMAPASFCSLLPSRISFMTVSITRISKRILKTPLIYASLFGIVYALLAAKYNWQMPRWAMTTLSFLADGTIGIAMVCMGVILAGSVIAAKSLWGLVPCGMKWLLAGFAARYIAAPIIMYISSLAFLLKGTVLRYAVVQVIIAQGSMGFALAKQYNCHMTIMLSATMVQMVSFIPVILAYYAVMEVI